MYQRFIVIVQFICNLKPHHSLHIYSESRKWKSDWSRVNIY